MILCFLSRTVAFEPVTTTAALVGVGAICVGLFYCHVKECCKERWIPQNTNSLKTALNEEVFGQHIAIEIVHNVIKGHIQNPSPGKALVLSFHGWTGCGKNHVSKIVADNLYKLGTDSQYTHQVIATTDFPHKNRVPEYKINYASLLSKKLHSAQRHCLSLTK